MNKKYIEGLILTLLVIISAFVTTNILTKISLSNNIQFIEKTIYSHPKIYIGEQDFEEKLKELNLSLKNDNNKEINNKEKQKEDTKINNTNNIKETSLENISNIIDFYKMKFGEKTFLLSDDINSYQYGFISKQYTNNILYLYSHNSYKYTENSGYYLYNHLKLNDIIIFNDDEKYKITKTLLVDINKHEDKNIELSNNVKIVYFTCTPYGDNIRKVFLLEKEDKQ